jgi:hypothetical protein
MKAQAAVGASFGCVPCDLSFDSSLRHDSCELTAQTVLSPRASFSKGRKQECLSDARRFQEMLLKI